MCSINVGNCTLQSDTTNTQIEENSMSNICTFTNFTNKNLKLQKSSIKILNTANSGIKILRVRHSNFALINC